MTIEERIELHEQWLHSIESNLSRVVDDLAAVTRNQVTFSDALAVLANNQAGFVAGMAHLTARVNDLAEQHRKLEQALEKYFRLHGNGREPK